MSRCIWDSFCIVSVVVAWNLNNIIRYSTLCSKLNPNILLGVFLLNLILRPNKWLSSLENLRGNVSHNSDGETYLGETRLEIIKLYSAKASKSSVRQGYMKFWITTKKTFSTHGPPTNIVVMCLTEDAFMVTFQTFHRANLIS